MSVKIIYAVNVVRFGHRSSELLGFGASDGRIAVCTVMDPPGILHHLEGHSKSITGKLFIFLFEYGLLRNSCLAWCLTVLIGSDFDFSLNNQYLCSSSMDRSVRIWDVGKEHCVRIVYDNTEQLCVRFHPVSGSR